MNENNVRVRFAPSPTGPLHMGGVRTALYNFLFAKANGGKFILRIEDTDQARFVEGAEEYIKEALKWCGLEVDEGMNTGGEFGPYKQSERSNLYNEAIETLLEKGKAYKAFDTPDELDALRKAAEAEKQVFQYDASTRLNCRNELALDSAEVEQLITDGAPYVVRFRTPDVKREVKFQDEIRGDVSFSSAVIDDKVLMKTDGLPTYHLANVVDDHNMEISHVIRGEEWLPSAPLHVLLYEAFGWKAPQFAHLPLILKPTGNGKLSKRDGDAGGFPVFPINWTDPKTGIKAAGYRENGYYPEAFINMLLMLGWSPGDEKEIFSLDEASNVFSLERIVKSGARFSPEKARWFNEHYLRSKSSEELAPEVVKLAAERSIELSEANAKSIADMMLERVSFLGEIFKSNWLFTTPSEADFAPKMIRKKWKDETSSYLHDLMPTLDAVEPFTSENIETAFKAHLEEQGLGFGQVLLPFRIALTGASGGPSMFDFAAYLGKVATMERLKKGIATAEIVKKKKS